MKFESSKSFDLWLMDNSPNQANYNEGRCKQDCNILLPINLIPIGTEINVSTIHYECYEYKVMVTYTYTSEEHDEVHNKLNLKDKKEYKLITKK